jgi:type VI secretion system protein ImpL
MKAFFIKLGSAIGKFWQNIIADWRIMLLIIVGLLLFIVSWFLWAKLSSFFLAGQLLMSLLTVLVYGLIITMVYGFRYLVKSSTLTTLAQKAKGIDALKPNIAASQVDVEIKQFLTHKLAWKRFIPLAVQKLFVRKKIYLLLEQQAQLADHLLACGWTCLDNPEQLPVNIWTQDKQVLIVADATNAHFPIVLKYLAKYSVLHRLSGVMQVVNVNDLLSQQAVHDIRETVLQQRQLLSRHTAFKGMASTVLISNLGSLLGTDEAMTIPEFSQFFSGNNNLSTPIALQYITANITKFSKSNPETVDNAKLYWLLNTLANLQEHLHTNDNNDAWLLLEPNGVANKMKLLSNTLVQLKKSRQDILVSRTKFGLLSGLILVLMLGVAAMIASFSVNYQKITSSITLLNDYQNLPWASYSKTDLTPAYKSYQLYSVYQNDKLLTHMGLYQGDKVEGILQPLFVKQINQRYVPKLVTDLHQLLADSVNKDQNIAQALSAYLMLGQPKQYDAGFVTNWLQTNKAPLANPESVAILAALQQKTFAVSKIDDELLAKAKKLLPSLSTQIRYQLLKQAGKMPVLDFNQALSGVADDLNKPASLNISSLYGKESLLAVVNHQPGNVVDIMMRNIWFYNTSGSQQALRQQILAEYVDSYINSWHVWTNKVQFNNTNSLDAANALAQRATESDGLWQKLGAIIVRNTRFSDVSTGPLTKVNQAFASWQAALNSAKLKNSRQAVRADFDAMANSVQTIAKAGNPNQAAFKTLQAALSSGEGIKGFATLDATVKVLPPAAQQWLLKLRTAVTAGVFAAAHHNITDNLKLLVASQLDTITSQYPFNADSQNDVDPAQLNKLFAKEGVVSKFVNEKINPFYAVDTGQSKALYGACINFSSDERKFYTLLADISNSFFGNNGDALQIAFTLSPTYLSNSVGSARLNLLNNTMDYQHGPQKPINYSWPTSLVNLDASLQLVKSNGRQLSLTDRGIWAWLRLIEKADAEPTAQKNVWKLRYHKGSAQFQLQVIASPAMNVVLNGDLANLQLASKIVENNYE